MARKDLKAQTRHPAQTLTGRVGEKEREGQSGWRGVGVCSDLRLTTGTSANLLESFKPVHPAATAYVCASVRVASPKNGKLWKTGWLEIRLARPDLSTVGKSLVLLLLFQYHRTVYRVLKQFCVNRSRKYNSSFADGRQLVTLIFLLWF